MFLKPKRAPLLLAIIISVVLIGVFATKSLYLESAEKNQKIGMNSESLFAGQQTKINSESPDLALIQENSLSGVSCPQIFSSKVLGSLIEGEETGGRQEIIEYAVQPGDNLSLIADKHGISLNTVLWANDLTAKSVINPGQKLIILPVTGAIHHVEKGDTVSEIAEDYEVEASEIVSFNDLSKEEDIYIGDILIIPNGTKPSPKYTASVQPSSNSQVPLASSYFIIPVASPYKVTQGYHWYNAIDFGHEGNSCGKPVFAAAGGEVQLVKYGYNKGAGNYIRILHPNGLITHYGHLQSILVNPGEKVSQGDLIGLIGYTGYTIPSGPVGCHLHFGLYSSQGAPPINPFAR